MKKVITLCLAVSLIACIATKSTLATAESKTAKADISANSGFLATCTKCHECTAAPPPLNTAMIVTKAATGWDRQVIIRQTVMQSDDASGWSVKDGTTGWVMIDQPQKAVKSTDPANPDIGVTANCSNNEFAGGKSKAAFVLRC